MTGGSGTGSPVLATDVDNWISAYWADLKTQLDAIDSDLYTDLKTEAATRILNYTTSHLIVSQILRAQALMVCVVAAGMPALAGWSQERHYKTLRIAQQVWTKTEGEDMFTGELRLLLPDWTDQSMVNIRASYFATVKNNNIFIAPKLDQRDELFRDKELQDHIDEWDEYRDYSSDDDAIS